MGKRVLMAMSGGIDSAVAAMLLQEQGFELVGITFRNVDNCMSNCPNDVEDALIVDPVEEARHLAEQLGFEHDSLDVREVFNQTVIRNFIDEYLHARTPNPCVWCNPIIKWNLLLQKADELHCDCLATGHYARIINQNGRCYLRKGKDALKDQTYFLWKLTNEQLSRTIFPLGEYTKTEVRDIAAQNGFVKLSQKTESEDICFLPDNNYRDFLKARVPDLNERMKPGSFVDVKGKVLGRHLGLYNYTIGQRKGLGIALGVPAYVVALDATRNRVVIGSKEDLQGRELFASDLNFTKYDDFNEGMQVNCRIRYRSQGALARLYHEDGGARVIFDAPVESITPGQSVVFYEDQDLIGGGIIR